MNNTVMYRMRGKSPTLPERTGLAPSTLYALLKQNKFPPGCRLTGARAVGWPSKVIDAWEASRATASVVEAA